LSSKSRSERIGPMPLVWYRSGNSACLAAKAAHQAAQKSKFIKTIAQLMQRVGTRRQIDRRTNRGYGRKWRPVTPFPGEFHHQVPAHRVAHQRYSLQSELVREVVYHRAHIARESRVIERGRKCIAAAAIAHIHAHNVEARGHARAQTPRMYCESDEPSSPWTRTAVSRLAGSGCQWQWHRTRLPSQGSTSTVSATAGSVNVGRGRKVTHIVCRWLFLRPRKGTNGVSHVDCVGAGLRVTVSLEISVVTGGLPNAGVGPSARDRLGAVSGDRSRATH